MAEHIQINDVTPRIIYTANGTQTAFTYPFAIFKAADLEVYLDGVKQGGGFIVTGAGSSTGGVATFSTAPMDRVQVTLRRTLVLARTSDYQADGIIRAKTLNDDLDYQIAALQQLAEASSRAIRRSPTSASTADLTLPEPVAGRVLKWGPDGSGLVNSALDPDGHVAAAQAAAAAASHSAGLADNAQAAAVAAQASAVMARNEAQAAAASLALPVITAADHDKSLTVSAAGTWTLAPQSSASAGADLFLTANII